MAPQAYSWTCSVCSIAWCLEAIYGQKISREEVGFVMGYPNCVNPTYGCMSTDCVKHTFDIYNLNTKNAYVTFDQAYAIARSYTGTINPNGMYHFMGIRGTVGSDIWVANSAQGYMGVYDVLDRARFNQLGPVEVIYIESYK